MSNAFDSLNDDEVRQIAVLVETLDRSTFDYLQVEVGSLKVTIGKGNAPQSLAIGAVHGVAAVPPQAQVVAAPAGNPASGPAVVAAQPPAQGVANEAAAPDGTIAVVAPMMGRFYAKPEPGSAPFVSLGAEVNKDATVGLIEIMKVFNAVQAGVSGVVTEICVQDAQFIEYGQVLFRLRPAQTSAGPGVKDSRP